MSKGRLVGPEELAGVLGVKTRHVYNLSMEGKIPKHKIGQLIRFDVDEVLAHLHQDAKNKRQGRR